MKLFYLLLFVTILFCNKNLQSQNVEKQWETDTVLNTPESVFFADTVLFVSCLNSRSDKKLNDGYIAKLTIDGQIINQKWAINLVDPRGLGVLADTLFVTDNDKLIGINIKSGEIEIEKTILQANYLNDIAVGNNTVYFSDMGGSAIYKYCQNTVSLLAADTLLKRVNGLCFYNDILYAGTNNNIYTVDTLTGQLKTYILQTGPVDGLERLDNNSMLTSDWAGKVQIVSRNSPPVILLNFSSTSYNAADITYSQKHRTIFIPTFFGNSVAAYILIE